MLLALAVAVALIGPADYPPAARRARQQGSVGVAVRADARGHALACRVVVSSGSRALDRATCPLLLKRGRFPRLPNRAAFGVYRQFVDWKL